MYELADAVQGARHTAQEITWLYEDGTAVDLSGAVLSGFKQDTRTGVVTALDGTLNAIDAEEGLFTWQYGAVDVATPGRYRVQFLATYGSNDVEKSLPAAWMVVNAIDDEV